VANGDIARNRCTCAFCTFQNNLSIGAIIGKEFVDRGASARSADRPKLQKMLEYIQENKGRVDYVIVHKVDRLARNRGDDADIARALGGSRC